jgi:ArsR family transcriptional regulator, arsenate/arsenite/antimonite-responsive transcriptional repressor
MRRAFTISNSIQIKTFKYFLNYIRIMGSPWKALSDDSRREILLLLKKRDMVPTEIAEHFNFTLPALSSHLRILREADLITENKKGKNRYYSVNRKRTMELIEFFEDMYDYRLNALKEYVENNEKKKEDRRVQTND